MENCCVSLCSESCNDSTTIFVFVLALTVNDFYHFENCEKSLVKILFSQFSDKLRPKLKKSNEQKSFTVNFYI